MGRSESISSDSFENLILGKDLCSREKRKSDDSNLLVCVSNCRYPIIRKIITRLNYKLVNFDDNWVFFWTDFSTCLKRCKNMNRYQKINHFPGMNSICRKELLARQLNRMSKIFPKDFNFFPRTWILPLEEHKIKQYSRDHRGQYYIIKPDCGSQGRGIFVTNSIENLCLSNRGVCQMYIARPFLIDGYKFDLRLYVLITSCNPLRIYIHKEGLVRFATAKYKEPNSVNLRNVFMHLTNYSVNKYSRTYNNSKEDGSKRKLSWFNKYMKKTGRRVEHIWKLIDDAIIKTIISAYGILKNSYMTVFPDHNVIPACCELLGIDIILDHNQRPKILEINHAPSFHTHTPIDKEIKELIINDTFSIMNLEFYQRLADAEKHRIYYDKQKLKEEYFEEEYNNRGGFRLIYPEVNTKDLYTKFFMVNDVSNVDLNESIPKIETPHTLIKRKMHLQLKVAKLAAKKMQLALMNKKLMPQIPVIKKTSLMKFESEINITKVGKTENYINQKEVKKKRAHIPPLTLEETYEKQYLQSIAQREYVIHSRNIAEYINFLKKRKLKQQEEMIVNKKDLTKIKPKLKINNVFNPPKL